MKLIRRSLVLLAAACALSVTAFAAESNARDQAKALGDIAAEHIKKVGLDQAAQDFKTDTARWSPKDLSVFVQDYSGVLRYHRVPKMIGKNMMEVKDSSGKEFTKEMIASAKGKGGFVDYEWMSAETKKVQPKTAYVRSVGSEDMFVGVAIGPK